MTETEKAIETLEGLTLCGICTGKEEGCKSCDRYNAKIQALKALREQQEREKGCSLCKQEDHKLYSIDGYYRDIDGDPAPLYGRIKVNFCPQCGRPIGEAKEDV